MRYRFLIIDSNNLFWRNWHIVSKFYYQGVTENPYLNTIYRSIQEILKLQKIYECSDQHVFLLFDNCSSKTKNRKMIYPQYKNDRDVETAPSNIYYSLSLFKELLKAYSDKFILVYRKGYEADDLTLPLKNALLKSLRKTEKMMFISGDLDWARNIDSNSHWYNWKVVYDREGFLKKEGYWPKENSVKLYKTFKGDSSDNIPVGVKAMPYDVLMDILEKYDSLEEIFKGLLTAKYDQKVIKRIYDSKRQLWINYKLVDFIPLDVSIEETIFQCFAKPKKIKFWFKFFKFPIPSWAVELEEVEDMLFNT